MDEQLPPGVTTLTHLNTALTLLLFKVVEGMAKQGAIDPHALSQHLRESMLAPGTSPQAKEHFDSIRDYLVEGLAALSRPQGG